MNRGRWRRAQGALEAPLLLCDVYAGGGFGGWGYSPRCCLSPFFFSFSLLLSSLSFIWKREQYWAGRALPDVTEIGPLGLFRDAAEKRFLAYFFVYARPSGSYIKLLLGIREREWKSHTGALMTQMCQKVPWRTSAGFITVRKKETKKIFFFSSSD